MLPVLIIIAIVIDIKTLLPKFLIKWKIEAPSAVSVSSSWLNVTMVRGTQIMPTPSPWSQDVHKTSNIVKLILNCAIYHPEIPCSRNPANMVYRGSILLPPRNIKVNPSRVPVPLIPNISPTTESGYPCKVWSSAGSNVIGVKFKSPKINKLNWAFWNYWNFPPCVFKAKKITWKL